MSQLIDGFNAIILILITLFIYLIYYYKKSSISKKKKLEDYLGLADLKQDIEGLNKKETILYFYCQKVVKKYFSTLVIFNEEYTINSNNTICIKTKKINVLSSDFTEKIILKTDSGESIDFIINVSYNMDNYYQLILDKIENPLSVQIVIYSKEDKFPNIKAYNNLAFKDFKEGSTLPYLKRYNLINMPKDTLYKIYADLTGKSVEEKNLFLLENINSLFVNFIVDSKKTEGKIFKLEENQEDNLFNKDFSDEEINLLKKIGPLKEKAIKYGLEKIKKEKFSDSILNEYKGLVKDEKYEKIIGNILSILNTSAFFNKYFNKNINKSDLDLFDTAIFIRFNERKTNSAILSFLFYLRKKNSIFSKNRELNNFQKLMIMINIQYYFYNFEEPEIQFFNLFDLPKGSPFIESEKLFFDFVKHLKTDSALYFFYLQINSSSGTDYISLDTWYKIKFIPLSKIKAHLMYSRHPFFFIYKINDKKSAFVNPQNLIINFSGSRSVGYFYTNSLVNEKSVDNTARVLFIKFHESAHSKFECGKYSDTSPRYFLNIELEKLDSLYDSIISYKLGKVLNDFKKKGDEIGEEGYAIELFIFGNYIKTDYLLTNFRDLTDFLKTDLYLEKNFEKLNNLFSQHLSKSNIEIIKKYENSEQNINQMKSRNIDIDIKTKIDNIEKNKKIIKNPIYFFNNYPLEANY